MYNSRPVNVLLTSVGRRAYLVNYFKEAVGDHGKIIAANSHPDAAGMLVADISCVLPSASTPGFIESLLEICSRYSVKILMSLHDWEAPFIAANLERFREVGTIPVVSNPSVINVCLDKMQTQEFALTHKISHPITLSNPEETRTAILSECLSLPLIVKPRYGQGSVVMEKLWSESDLMSLHALLMQRLHLIRSNGLLTSSSRESLIFQENIKGQEFGLDIVNDFEGKFVACFVLRKLSMRSGETEVAETVKDHMLDELGRKIGTALGHIGVLDVDLIVRNGVPYLIDMNPRFGGHYPFSHMAGANLPAAYVAWALGTEPDPSWFHIRAGVKCFKNCALLVN